MASDTNENALADFDIDEVIDWDKHDIPSKVCWVYSQVILVLGKQMISQSNKSARYDQK